MKLTIRGVEPHETLSIKQMLMFYLGKIEHGVVALNFDFYPFESDAGERHCSAILTTRLVDGRELRIDEIQADARLAVKRLMDRLERHLHRRQMARNLGLANYSVRLPG